MGRSGYGPVAGYTEYIKQINDMKAAKKKAAAKRRRKLLNKAKRDRRIQKMKAMPYSDYLKTRHWRKLRVVVLKKAGHKCSICGETENLNVHHLTYARVGYEKLSDLEVLCRGCHENEHEGEIAGVFDPMAKEFMELVRSF